MPLLKVRGNPEAHPGEWVDYQVDPENKKPVRFRIRSLPEAKEREIGRKHLGRKFEMFLRRRKASVEHDLEKLDAANAEAAEWCWLDSENFLGVAEDSEGAEEYGKLLGITIGVGEQFTFDGRLTVAVKRHLLGLHHHLAAWIVERAKDAQLRSDEERAEEETGKG
jgi:hypothetical protein